MQLHLCSVGDFYALLIFAKFVVTAVWKRSERVIQIGGGGRDS